MKLLIITPESIIYFIQTTKLYHSVLNISQKKFILIIDSFRSCATQITHLEHVRYYFKTFDNMSGIFNAIFCYQHFISFFLNINYWVHCIGYCICLLEMGIFFLSQNSFAVWIISNSFLILISNWIKWNFSQSIQSFSLKILLYNTILHLFASVIQLDVLKVSSHFIKNSKNKMKQFKW